MEKRKNRTENGAVIIVIGPELKTVIVTEKSRRNPLSKFPGGGIEEGETPEIAVARELKEETGLSIIPETLKALGQAFNEKKNGYTYFFSGRVKDFSELIEVGTDYEIPEVIDLEEIQKLNDANLFLKPHFAFLKTFNDSGKIL